MTVNENEDGLIKICVAVTGSGTIGNPFTVELVVASPPSTATLGMDYQFGILHPDNSKPMESSLLIDFPSGTDLEQCGIVSIINDNVYEDVETLVLEIDGTSPYDVQIGPANSITITIMKDIKGKLVYHLQHKILTCIL
jgi:hypothetical protein